MTESQAGRFRLEIHDELASTSDLCIERALAGEPHGLAILAYRQTAGRGRFGRQWQAPDGNLNLSLLLRPAAVFLHKPPATGWLALVVAVALWQSVAATLHSPDGLLIKWPNDLLLDGGKLAGVLIEAGDDWIVVGIGVNLAEAPLLPEKRTACLADRIDPPSPETFAAVLIEKLGLALALFSIAGQGLYREQWLDAAHPIGSALFVSLADGISIEGRFAGLTDDGALLLDRGMAVETIRSGEVLLA